MFDKSSMLVTKNLIKRKVEVTRMIEIIYPIMKLINYVGDNSQVNTRFRLDYWKPSKNNSNVITTCLRDNLKHTHTFG